jgi:hypothetical protein
MSWPRLTAAQLTAMMNQIQLPVIEPQVAGVSQVINATGITLLAAPTEHVFDIHVGTIGGTSSPEFSVIFQHAPTLGGSYVDVAAADLREGLITNITAANDAVVLTREYVGANRFIKVRIDNVAGSTPTLPVSVTTNFGLRAGSLRPHQIRQIQEELNARAFDIGSGDHGNAKRMTDVF